MAHNSECETAPIALFAAFLLRGVLEARVRIELTYKGFADLSLTTWVPRPVKTV
jgi:hypothetical protein